MKYEIVTLQKEERLIKNGSSATDGVPALLVS